MTTAMITNPAFAPLDMDALDFPEGRIEATVAAEVVRSPMFGTTGRNERDPIVCDQDFESALERYVEAGFRRGFNDPERIAAEEALEIQLEKQALEMIAEALSLAGVTEPATVNEIARRVIRGE